MSEWSDYRPLPAYGELHVKKDLPAPIITPASISVRYGFSQDDPMLWILYLQFNKGMPDDEKQYIKDHIIHLKALKRNNDDVILAEFEKRRTEYIEECREKKDDIIEIDIHDDL